MFQETEIDLPAEFIWQVFCLQGAAQTCCCQDSTREISQNYQLPRQG